MKSARKWIGAASLIAALLAFGSSAWAQGAAPAAAAPANPGYTTAEYNAYQAFHSDTNPQTRLQKLDDFMARYNTPALLKYAYGDYYATYSTLKNFPKTIEYMDKYIALGDRITAAERLNAQYQRAQIYEVAATEAAFQTPEMLTKTRENSAQGLTALAALQKPPAATEEAFANIKKTIGFKLNVAAGIAATYQKDFKAAQTSFKAAVVINPEDNAAHYRLGGAYLQDTPVQANDGFWEFGRAIALKYPGADQVRTFMRTRLMQYQQPGCEKLADDQITEILSMSAAANDRPADFNIPSAQELQAARDDTTNFLPWLQEGGAHAKTMWLATCGLEYPDVTVRVMEIVPGDTPDKFTLKAFQAATEEAMKAATAPNAEIQIAGQPDVRRIPKDDYVRFTGTLNGYQASPFMLTWGEAKVNAQDLQDIPVETTAPAPGRGGRPAAAPGRGRGGQ